VDGLSRVPLNEGFIRFMGRVGWIAAKKQEQDLLGANGDIANEYRFRGNPERSLPQ
jgi:hypothetical protein